MRDNEVIRSDKSLSALLGDRRLPALKTREEMLEILQREEYGYMPPLPQSLRFQVQEDALPNFAGKARCHRVTAEGTVGGRAFAFPFIAVLPTDGAQHPFFIHINFRDLVPDRYMPTEELVDRGYAVLSFCHNDVTTDDGDFTNGLAGALFACGKRTPTDPGKIAMWAWAAQRVLDWALTRTDVLDPARAIVCGHSRLGKTALLAAATDTRFYAGYSNDSGSSGAAIARGRAEGGETVAHICRVFPFWFCENYCRYTGNEDAMPFDQHELLACIAPRRCLIGSASLDRWADPVSEQLSVLAASPAFRNPAPMPDRPAAVGEAFLRGDIGYHLRKGTHFFSRSDWLRLMEFIEIEA
ncbi:MAG: hypothetical protein IJT41_13090 [Clostridia bacterium]|nr:hypothetical protein [Clostridia bacterium]